MQPMKSHWETLVQFIDAFIEHQLPQLAAAVAFYAALSLAPVLMLTMNAATYVFGAQTTRAELLAQTQSVLGPEAARVVEDVLQEAARDTGETHIQWLALLTLIFSGSGVFAQIQHAMNTIWEVRAEPNRRVWNFLRKRVLAVIMVAGIGLLVLISVALSTVTKAAMSALQESVAPSSPFWGLANLFVSLLVFTLLFALMFKVLPDAVIAWRDIWTGAAVTAVMFAAGKELISSWFGRSIVASAYGAAGSLVILLLWVYYSSLILFLGAELIQLHARRRGAATVPEDYAVPAEPAHA